MIENAIKIGKIKVPSAWGAEEEVHMVGQECRMQPSRQTSLQPQSSTRKRRRTFREKAPIDPILMAYVDLPPVLFRDDFSTLIYSEPKKPTKGHNATITCDYHIGTTGHSTEDCGALEHNVQGSVQIGILKFQALHQIHMCMTQVASHCIIINV